MSCLALFDLEMKSPNSNYLNLLLSLQKYCKRRRRFKTATDVHDAASELRDIVASTLPKMTSSFDKDAPDIVFVEQVIEFGIELSGREDLMNFWHKFYTGGWSASELSRELGCNPRAVYHRAHTFPVTLAVNLWSNDWATESNFTTTTSEQRLKITFMKEYGLSPKQADVLFLYFHFEELGRLAIAKKLYVSTNTLKKHIRKILKKMGVSSMREATIMAKNSAKNTHSGVIDNDTGKS